MKPVFCDVCGKKCKTKSTLKLEYEYTGTCGAGNWYLCKDCEKKVSKKLNALLDILWSE